MNTEQSTINQGPNEFEVAAKVTTHLTGISSEKIQGTGKTRDIVTARMIFTALLKRAGWNTAEITAQARPAKTDPSSVRSMIMRWEDKVHLNEEVVCSKRIVRASSVWSHATRSYDRDLGKLRGRHTPAERK